jgi:hypothetical protein
MEVAAIFWGWLTKTGRYTHCGVLSVTAIFSPTNGVFSGQQELAASSFENTQESLRLGVSHVCRRP